MVTPIEITDFGQILHAQVSIDNRNNRKDIDLSDDEINASCKQNCEISA